jgi:citrate lyase subunit beta-like protein
MLKNVQVRLSPIQTLVLPKIHSAKDLDAVSMEICATLQSSASSNRRHKPINLVASIESAKSLYNIGEIAGWKSVYGPTLGGQVIALLVGVRFPANSIPI